VLQEHRGPGSNQQQPGGAEPAPVLVAGRATHPAVPVRKHVRSLPVDGRTRLSCPGSAEHGKISLARVKDAESLLRLERPTRGGRTALTESGSTTSSARKAPL